MTIPKNIVDVASQIKSGTLGVIELIKIGDLQVSALTALSAPREKEVTRRRVQAGFSVINGVIELPTDIVLEIVLSDPDFSPEAGVTAALTGSWAGFTESWRDKRDTLLGYYNTNEVLSVVTHENVYPTRVISKIDPLFDANENWNCYIASVTFTPFDNKQLTSAADVNSALTASMINVGGL